MNVLIIEDDPTDLKLVCSILLAEGHEISTARSAEDALVILANKLPQLILTELALPGMDGVALVGQLKASALTAGIPVVAITAYPDMLSNRSRQREAGFAAFVVKPIDPVVFPGLLTAACGHN